MSSAQKRSIIIIAIAVSLSVVILFYSAPLFKDVSPAAASPKAALAPYGLPSLDCVPYFFLKTPEVVRCSCLRREVAADKLSRNNTEYSSSSTPMMLRRLASHPRQAPT